MELLLHFYSYPPSFFKKILGGQDLSGVKAIEWGINNEANAIRKFTEATGLEVIPCGIFLHTSGIIGASPDGLVNEDAIIEVKCPFRLRNATAEEVIMDPKYCFRGTSELDKNHEYYHQIQGQLFLTNRSLCYLVIWTTVDVIICLVQADPQWANNIQTLYSFYYNVFLDKLLN